MKLGTDVIWVGSQWYVAMTPTRTSRSRITGSPTCTALYQLTKELQLYGVVNNLFNRKFATFGTYFDPQSVINAVSNPPTDHRTVTPAQPLSVYVGLRAKL